MTNVDIISGFFREGTTTFIKKLINEVFKGEKIVLIENEFGEIGIDGGFLKDAGIEITEMNSGCICCSLVGDFSKSLKEVIEKFSPDRIIIEPSGVGKLSDVEKAILDVKDELDIVLDSKITVVDGKKAKMYMKNFGEFFNNQVESANVVVMSRTQDMTEEKTEECLELLKEHNKEANIITTPWDELEKDAVLNAVTKFDEENELMEEVLKSQYEHEHHHKHEEKCDCGHEHHHERGENCECEHEHHYEQGEECECGHHHDEHHKHKHDETCECGHSRNDEHREHEKHEHHHHHEHECELGHRHHKHDKECECGHEHYHEEHKHPHDHEHHHEHGEGCSCGHDHDADEVFTSFGVETVHKFNKRDLEDVLEILSDGSKYGVVLRAKGVVEGEDDKWYEFDLVPGEYEIRERKADYTGKVCVIGTELKKDKLEKIFK